MRQSIFKLIGRDLIVGLILASFVFSPQAFAKPNNNSKKRAVPYKDMYMLVKKPGTKRISDIAEAVKPMLKKRENKRFLKEALRVWDTKLDGLVVGRNYFKFRLAGKTYFGRYVDRGAVAFVLNNKPVLWKDVLFYSKFKDRVNEIVTGRKPIQISMFEKILGYFSNELFAEEVDATQINGVSKEACESVDGKTWVSNPDKGIEGCYKCDTGKMQINADSVRCVVPTTTGNEGVTPDGKGGAVIERTVCIDKKEMDRVNAEGGDIKTAAPCTGKYAVSCPSLVQKREGNVVKEEIGINVICDAKKEIHECASWNDPKKRDRLKACPSMGEDILAAFKDDPNLKFYIAGGLAALALLLFLLLRNKKKKRPAPAPQPPDNPDPPTPPEPPEPPYVPGGESTCPPVGSRGITQEERDKLPGCNKSNCIKDGTCTGSTNDETIN